VDGADVAVVVDPGTVIGVLDGAADGIAVGADWQPAIAIATAAPIGTRVLPMRLT
jgi:hypothetical protein